MAYLSITTEVAIDDDVVAEIAELAVEECVSLSEMVYMLLDYWKDQHEFNVDKEVTSKKSKKKEKGSK